MMKFTGPLAFCFGSALAVAGFPALPANAASYVVTTPVDESIADADLSLREALELSNANAGPDTITFEASLQGATITLVEGMLVASGNTMINGTNQVIDANGNSRVLLIAESGRITLGNLTLTNGSAGTKTDGTSDGGAILVDSIFAITLNNVDITDSQAYDGGAISISNFGTVTVNGGEIVGNSASHAGGAIHSSARSPSLVLNGVTGAYNTVGPGPGDGGFLYAAAGSDTQINGGSFIGNVASRDGGALWNDQGELTLTGPTIIDGNTANGAASSNGGGGIFQSPYGTLTIGTGARISNNIAGGSEGRGGGILNYADLNVSDSKIVGNRAEGAGGGIALAAGSDSTLYQVTVSDNHAGSNREGPSQGNGGGVHIAGQSFLQIDKSTLSHNVAMNAGGGLWIGQGLANVSSSTISGNAALRGGGVVNSGGGGSMALFSSTVARNMGAGICMDAGTTITRNTIVSDNSAAACAGVGTLYSAGATLLDDVAGCNFESAGISDIVGSSALLAELADNGGATETHLPELASPALDAGVCVVGTDQRGMARPVDLAAYPNADNGCDIGAVELQFAGDTIFFGDFEVP